MSSSIHGEDDEVVITGEMKANYARVIKELSSYGFTYHRSTGKYPKWEDHYTLKPEPAYDGTGWRFGEWGWVTISKNMDDYTDEYASERIKLIEASVAYVVTSIIKRL